MLIISNPPNEPMKVTIDLSHLKSDLPPASQAAKLYEMEKKLDEQKELDLITELITDAVEANRRVVYSSVSKPVAAYLHNLGYTYNHGGFLGLGHHKITW